MSRYIDAEIYRSVLRGASEGYYDDSFEKVLDAIPTADVVEVRHGKWKISELPKGKKLKYCSECGFGQNMHDERSYNFCPNCGADMRGET